VNISQLNLRSEKFDDDDDNNNNNNNNNTFPYYLCAVTTATRSITHRAQGHNENTKTQATN
jgi:hypothetical protein